MIIRLKGTRFIFSELGTYKPGERNVYSEIKRKLIEYYGIPAHSEREQSARVQWMR